MKLCGVFFVVFATFTGSVSAQTNKAVSSLPAVPGWRLPTQSDMKGQWTEKYWDVECRKYEEADKKAKGDAIEKFGSAEAERKERESGNVKPEPAKPTATKESETGNIECWKPVFPVHVAYGDYDGDGIQDEARILISTTKRSLAGIFVFLATKKIRVVRIDASFVLSPAQNHVISTQPPSDEEIQTACYAGKYWDCRPGEPSVITLKRDGLVFGQFESWSSIAYWDSRLNKFKVVQISD